MSVRLRKDQREWLKSRGNISETIRNALDDFREKIEEQPVTPDFFWVQRKIQGLNLKFEQLLKDQLYKHAKKNLDYYIKEYCTFTMKTMDNGHLEKVNVYRIIDLETSKVVQVTEDSEEFKNLHERSKKIVEAFEKKIDELKAEKRKLEDVLCATCYSDTALGEGP